MEIINVKVRASDAATYLAKLHKLNLAEIKGTGAGGRVVREDVDKAIAAKAKAKADNK